MTNEHHSETQRENDTTSMYAIVVHLLWLFFGPFALCGLLIGIWQSGGVWFTGIDLGFLITVALMICARWIDQRSGQSITVYGEPSTWTDFRRYALFLPILASVAWIVVKAIKMFL